MWYKWLKSVTILSALFVPVLSTVEWGRPYAAGLGIAIAAAEGLQQMNQFQATWIAYRSTCESLKHEKYLYLGRRAHMARRRNRRRCWRSGLRVWFRRSMRSGFRRMRNRRRRRFRISIGYALEAVEGDSARRKPGGRQECLPYLACFRVMSLFAGPPGKISLAPPGHWTSTRS